MQKGFTLVELIVTVVIIGIIMAVAAPNIYNYVKRAENIQAEDEERLTYIAEQNRLSRAKASGRTYSPEVTDEIITYSKGPATPYIEVINDVELILNISSFSQPDNFIGYRVLLKGENSGCIYEKVISLEQIQETAPDNYYYSLILDSPEAGYLLEEILASEFLALAENAAYIPGEDLIVQIMAAAGLDDDSEGYSFSNEITVRRGE